MYFRLVLLLVILVVAVVVVITCVVVVFVTVLAVALWCADGEVGKKTSQGESQCRCH